MKSSTLWCSLVVSLVLMAGCSGKQKTVDAPPPPPPVETGPTVPTCGAWVVVTEPAVVTAGGYTADALQRALMTGLQQAGCTSLTAAPAALPEGTAILNVSLKASAIGTAGKISAVATNATTGEIVWRLQESAAAGSDGTAAASAIGAKIAAGAFGG